MLHYLYTKSAFRDQKDEAKRPGIAIGLLRHLGMADGRRFRFTFRTRSWDKFMASRRLNGKFEPKLIRGMKEDDK